MNNQFTTQDTGEAITAPQLPADDRTGTGYDWMETLTGTPWATLANWGSEGWDAGAWPYIIFAAAKHFDEKGHLSGDGLYIEGDTHTHWFRARAACHEGITAAVFDFWKMGQSDGPKDLPATAAELPRRYRHPYLGWVPRRTPPKSERERALWKQRASELEQFVREQGRFPKYRTAVEPLERILAVWTDRQRPCLRRGTLHTARKNWLDGRVPGWR